MIVARLQLQLEQAEEAPAEAANADEFQKAIGQTPLGSLIAAPWNISPSYSAPLA